MNSKTLLTSTERQQLAARKARGYVFYFLTLLPVILAILLILVLLFSVISDTFTWQVVKPSRSSSGQTFAVNKARSWEGVVRLELTAQGKTSEEIEAFFQDSDEIRKFRARNRIEKVWVPKNIYEEGGWRWVVSGSRDKLVDNYGYWEGLNTNEDLAGFTALGEAYWDDRVWKQETLAWLQQLPPEIDRCDLVDSSVISKISLPEAEAKVREVLENFEPTATADLLVQVRATRFLLKGLTDEKKHRQHVAEIAGNVANGHNLYLNPWFDFSFLRRNNSGKAWLAGLSTALLGSIWVIGLVILITLPFGVGAAVYLEEYAPENAFSSFLEVNLRNLAGIPSIVYGILGLYVFVRFMSIGPTILAAALTLSLLVLPVVIIAAREAIRSVPDSLRQASYGLGATKWQTTRLVVLPNAITGIVTGIILSLARAIGETAPLLLVGGAGFITQLPKHPLSSYVVMPSQIYSWLGQPQNAFDHAAAAGIIALLIVLIILYVAAFFIRQRFERKY